ncbi:MAG: hypothetical protein KBT20_05245 [Bacteroidales bacterium]|nr:hypothetical protein [Candidatus Liminaster caballi]
MKYFLSVITVVCSFCSLFAQSTQNGIVKEYNNAKKKTALSGVELIISNAGSNISDNNGRFVLNFRTLKPGDKVDVRKIEKEGYEVFNKEAIEAWRIANDGSEFNVVLCKSSEFKALKDQYNAMASQSYAEQHRKEEERLADLLKQGKIQQAQYDQKLRELQNRFDEQIENLDTYIDHFARIDLETISKKEQKIIEMVQAGRIDEAIAAYEALDLEDKYATAVEKIQVANEGIKKLQKVIEKSENERLDIYRQVKNKNNLLIMLGGEENFARVKNNLIACADQDTTMLEVVAGCAQFLFDQRDYKLAEKYYEIVYRRYSDLAGENLDKRFEFAQICHDMCILYTFLKQYDKAETYMLRAFELIEEIADHEPSTVSLLSVQCKNVYMKLLLDLRRFDEAETLGVEAIGQIRTMYEDDKDKCRDTYIKTCNNLSLVYTEIMAFDKAIEILRQLLPLEEEALALNESPSNKQVIVSSCNILANALIYSGVGVDEADRLLMRAVELSRELFEYNPDAYRDSYVVSCHSAGQNYFYCGMIDKAIQYMEMADGENEILLQKSEDSYMSFCIDNVNNLSYLNLVAGNYEKSLSGYMKVLPLCRRMYEQNPKLSINQYVRLLANIGLVQLKLGKSAEAHEYIGLSYDMYKDYTTVTLDDHLLLMAVLSFKGLLYLTDGEKDKALEIYNQIIADDPNYFKLNATIDFYVRLIEEKLIEQPQ